MLRMRRIMRIAPSGARGVAATRDDPKHPLDPQHPYPSQRPQACGAPMHPWLRTRSPQRVHGFAFGARVKILLTIFHSPPVFSSAM